MVAVWASYEDAARPDARFRFGKKMRLDSGRSSEYRTEDRGAMGNMGQHGRAGQLGHPPRDGKPTELTAVPILGAVESGGTKRTSGTRGLPNEEDSWREVARGNRASKRESRTRPVAKNLLD
jgi:hypothetical protein